MRRVSALLLAFLVSAAIACKKPCLKAETTPAQIDLCTSHPFGRAIGCGGVEEPQTFEGCTAVLRLNPGICVSSYVACRDAIRLAGCDVCPPECADVAGAC